MAKKKRAGVTDVITIDVIKRRAVIAMFSDNQLLEKLTLKGGNALHLIYGIGARASFDIDFSIDGDFESVGWLQARVTRALNQTFDDVQLIPFDVSVEQKPRLISEDMEHFWGGYDIKFKIISRDEYEQLSHDIDSLRNGALRLDDDGRRNYEIQMSRHEFCKGRQAFLIDNYEVFAYSRELLVAEKLRALCQHTDEYGQIVRRSYSASPRARDFVDIYHVVTRLHFRYDNADFREAVVGVFAAKRVPLQFLNLIQSYREFHRADFASVLAAMPPYERQNIDFDVCFDFVLDISKTLEPLWHEETP